MFCIRDFSDSLINEVCFLKSVKTRNIKDNKSDNKTENISDGINLTPLYLMTAYIKKKEEINIKMLSKAIEILKFFILKLLTQKL